MYGDHFYGYGPGKLLAQAFTDALGNAQYGGGSGGGGGGSSGEAMRESSEKRGVTEESLENVLATAQHVLNPASVFEGWGSKTMPDAAKAREVGSSGVGQETVSGAVLAVSNDVQGGGFLVPDKDRYDYSRSSRIARAKRIFSSKFSSPTPAIRDGDAGARGSDARAEAAQRSSVGAERRPQYRHGSLDWTQVTQRVHAQNDGNVRSFFPIFTHSPRSSAEKVEIERSEAPYLTSASLKSALLNAQYILEDSTEKGGDGRGAGSEQEKQSDASAAYMAFPAGVQL